MSSDEENNNVYNIAKRKRNNAPAWKKQLAKELLKPELKRFSRRSVFSSTVDAIWAVDLADIQQYARVIEIINSFLLLLIFFQNTHGQDH